MKPIAQTFYINEPDNGVPGVYLTAVELFFQSKSDTYGVEIQIRLTENGNPTSTVLPFGSVKLPSSMIDVSPTDASNATKFNFTSPIFLQSATSYAIVIIPAGGNPDYNIWTAELNSQVTGGGIDVTTQNPIKTNNDTGTLFLSSNDIQWTAVQTEDIKFNLYVADFTKGGTVTPSGQAVFSSRDSDYLLLQEQNGTFSQKEYVVISNSHYNIAKIKYGSGTITGSFVAGDIIYQTNATAGRSGTKSVTGKIFDIDPSTYTIKIANIVSTNGGFAAAKGPIYSGPVESSNKIISSLVTDGSVDTTYDSVITIAGSNTIQVPYTTGLGPNTYFEVGQMIYVGQNERTIVQPSTIIQVDSTSLTLSSTITFTESNAIIGRIRGDGKLYGKIEASDIITNPNRIQVTLGEVTSPSKNDTFSPAKGQFLIGADSGTSANIIMTTDANYNTIIPQFAESKPPGTFTDWTFVGSEITNGTRDSSPNVLINNVEKELNDYPRILMSRSNEVQYYNGNPSTLITATMNSSNGYISPIIDTAKTVLDVVGNAITRLDQLTGYRLTLSRNNVNYTPANTDNHNFKMGQIVIQNNIDLDTPVFIGQANVSFQNESEIIVTGITGYFSTIATNSSGNSVLLRLSSDETNNTQITNINYFSEDTNNNLKYASRYISKSVVLAEGQDAEDIRVYLTAYRPANTDLLVYARIMNKEDPGSIDNNAWSLLQQITSPALLSSSANKDDMVEIQYGFPTATEITASGVRVSAPSTLTFDGSTAVDLTNYRIKLSNIDDPVFKVGDRIQYYTDTNASAPIGALSNNAYYYVNTKGLAQTTFNGTSAVSTAAKTITVTGSPYPFTVGDRVLYKSVTGAPIGGLANNTYYYVRNISGTALNLSTILNGDIISFTSVGSSDTGHSLSSQYITLTAVDPATTDSPATVQLTMGATGNQYLATDSWITVSDLSEVQPQDFVYFDDATNDSNQFFVAKVQRKSLTDKRNMLLMPPANATVWPPFSIANASFGVIKGLQWATAGFIYPKTNNIVRYTSGIKGDSVVYDGYKTFAIKIVPVADSTSVIPRVKDMRAIALQV